MKVAGIISAAAITVLGALAPAQADVTLDKNCNVGKSGEDLNYSDAHKVYSCLEKKMFEGYNTGPKKWVNASHVAEYRTWEAASTMPANPGVHSERFLFTYVNPIGEAAYMQFAEGVRMPVGTVIAKESFNIDSKGKASPGPLFIMEKVAVGKSPKTGDWFYTMVAPTGKPQGINVYTACHACHAGYEDSDFVAYPEEKVRRTN